jgi:hypothetical protein
VLTENKLPVKQICRLFCGLLEAPLFIEAEPTFVDFLAAMLLCAIVIMGCTFNGSKE